MKSESTDFIRDDHNNALINTNINAFNLYKQQRKTLMFQSAQEKEIASLKDELAQLKSLLKEIIREKNG